MADRVRVQTYLLGVFAILSMSLAPSHGAQTPADPRMLMKESADRLADAILDTASQYRLASRSDQSLALLDAVRRARCPSCNRDWH